MKFTVYILFSDLHKKFYVGFTSNIEIRLRSHNEFGKGWTARYRPWRIIHTKGFNTKAEAMKYEKWLEPGAGRDFIKTLQHSLAQDLYPPRRTAVQVCSPVQTFSYIGKSHRNLNGAD